MSQKYKQKNNSLLLKSTLKYLVYCQVFWIEVWCLYGYIYMNIYMGVGVTAFSITCHVKKTVQEM